MVWFEFLDWVWTVCVDGVVSVLVCGFLCFVCVVVLVEVLGALRGCVCVCLFVLVVCMLC